MSVVERAALDVLHHEDLPPLVYEGRIVPGDALVAEQREANILVTWAGLVKVVDFGIAKSDLDGRTQTLTGAGRSCS